MHVVLHERVQRLPAEGLGELFSPDGFIRELEFVKDSLKSKSDTLGGVVAFGWHFIHSLKREIKQFDLEPPKS